MNIIFQDPNDGKYIIPNKELSTVLKLKKGDPKLHWFNIQSFLKSHYMKEETKKKNVSLPSE